jgi:DNA-binding NarL/FixJ family response regulator
VLQNCARSGHITTDTDPWLTIIAGIRNVSVRNPLLRLTEREHEVLALMAQGRSNTPIAQRLVVAVKTVESHIASIFTKLDLHDAPDDHRRVLAVLTALRGAEG